MQSQKPTHEPLLTITLDAEASAAVRRFASEIGEEPQDTAVGAILDCLPQCLKEWDEEKNDPMGRTKSENWDDGYFVVTRQLVRAARLRRLKRNYARN